MLDSQTHESLDRRTPGDEEFTPGRVDVDAFAGECTDEAAWQPIVKKAMQCYRDYLKALADRGLGAELRPKVDASDVVQETFAEVYREYHRFVGLTDEEFKALLVRMMRNNLKSFARRYRGALKRAVGREVSMDGHGEEHGFYHQLAAPGASPGELVSDREDLGRLNARLDLLPERDRLAFTWRAQDGRTYREIGDRLGCSQVAARKRWLRVVERLRRELNVSMN